MESLESYIRRMASSECLADDPNFIIGDSCGGNSDDAYNIGIDDGYAMLAREILRLFFPDAAAN